MNKHLLINLIERYGRECSARDRVIRSPSAWANPARASKKAASTLAKIKVLIG